MKDLMTLREAAEAVGTSKTRLWRSIKDELLEAQAVKRGKQKIYKVSKVSLMAWADRQDDLELVREVTQRSETTRNVTNDTFEAMRNDTKRYAETPVTVRNDSEPTVPLSAFETTQATLKQALQDALEVAREQREDRLDAERRAEEAEEKALRVARQLSSFMYEMENQKLLLAESSESLIEKEAALKEAEALKEKQAEEIQQAEETVRSEFESVLEDREGERDLARAEATQAKAEAELLKAQLAEVEVEKERLAAEQSRPWWKKILGS